MVQLPRVWSQARGRSRLLVCVGVILVGIGACERDQVPTSSLTKHADISRAQLIPTVRGSHRLRLAEKQVVRLANEIPGFAGYYIEAGSGQLVAYVKDSVQKFPSATASLNAHLAQDGLGIPAYQRPHSVRIKQADYDFQTLSDFRDFVSDSLLGLSGVRSVGLDQKINRVTVGIRDAQAEAFVLDQLRQHSIPAAAVNFQFVPNPTMMIAHGSLSASTKSRRYGSILESGGTPDSLAGGLPFTDTGNGGTCTIGAVVDSGSTRMFMSASHCTTHMYQLNGDTVATEAGLTIGYERGDRAYTGTGCNLLWCWDDRSSDAAVFSIVNSLYTPSRKGVIARPGTRSQLVLNAARDTSINSSHPWLFVGGTLDASYLVAGETIDHVGIRSGWTYGTITNTCDDFVRAPNNGDPHMKVYCEARSDNMGVPAGDSGGPVFLWDGYDGAILIGTLTGCAGSQGSYTYNGQSGILACTGGWASYWSANEYDQGTFDALIGTTVGTPSITGSVSGGDAVASWSAVSTTNTTATTQYQIFQWTWDASTSTYSQNGFYVGSNTSTSYTDASAPWTITSSVGATQPDVCTYSSVGIEIRAYNQGVFAYSNTIWFQGPANGSGGGAC